MYIVNHFIFRSPLPQKKDPRYVVKIMMISQRDNFIRALLIHKQIFKIIYRKKYDIIFLLRHWYYDDNSSNNCKLRRKFKLKAMEIYLISITTGKRLDNLMLISIENYIVYTIRFRWRVNTFCVFKIKKFMFKITVYNAFIDNCVQIYFTYCT